MQLKLPLPKTPTLAANTNTQKKGLATVPTIPQHEKRPGTSHRRSQNAGQIESRQEESQTTLRTKETQVRGSRQVHEQGLYFDDVADVEKSKKMHPNIGSNAPKRLKSIDSRAPRRSKEDLRDYLQRKRQDAEITSNAQSKTPFSVELDAFEVCRYPIFYGPYNLDTIACTPDDEPIHLSSARSPQWDATALNLSNLIPLLPCFLAKPSVFQACNPWWPTGHPYGLPAITLGCWPLMFILLVSHQ
ncbi:unnamed protein product [Camellia sinensis]